ncbi:MAG: hypothetical protein MI807_04000 [Verrucomicrobiales bacterium]|nr:hypothetical protein [Verrucomicrobiales bacterium]
MAFRELDTEWDEVLIIDLLSNDERSQHKISTDLREFLGKNGIEQLQMNCSTNAHVDEALALALSRAKDKRFMIHFTAHGCETGIGNNDGISLVPWDTLKKPLTEINEALSGDLVINMIACKGLNALKIDDLVDPAHPYYALIGPTRDLSFEEAYRITQSFYKKLLVDAEMPRIVKEIIEEEGETIIFAQSAQARRGDTMSLTDA